jgi:hypothetical protein
VATAVFTKEQKGTGIDEMNAPKSVGEEPRNKFWNNQEHR